MPDDGRSRQVIFLEVMLSAREVAELTGWPLRTVRYRAQTGRIPAVSILNNRNRSEYHNRHRQRRTDLLHAFGVCVRCQRRDAAPGRAQCVYCLARSRRYMQSRLREKGVMPRDMLGWPGICSRCGKPTNTQEAHKLCPACREASQHAMEIARNSRTEKNWFARTHSLMAFGKP